MKSSRIRFLLTVAAVAAAAACSSESSTAPGTISLAGLNKTAPGDTSNTVHQPTGTGSGVIRGRVVGPALPGSGADSLNTAPRIAGVVVTIYERDVDSDEPVTIGAAKATVTTGADGAFTLPTLPAGEYLVTFEPPASAGYYGAYAYGSLRENSSEYPWWIVLAKKP